MARSRSAWIAPTAPSCKGLFSGRGALRLSLGRLLTSRSCSRRFCSIMMALNAEASPAPPSPPVQGHSPPPSKAPASQLDRGTGGEVGHDIRHYAHSRALRCLGHVFRMDADRTLSLRGLQRCAAVDSDGSLRHIELEAKQPSGNLKATRKDL